MHSRPPFSNGLVLLTFLLTTDAHPPPVRAALPNDPDLSLQWALVNTGQTVESQSGIPNADINIETAWALHQGDPAFIVAIVGSGVTPHPEFEHRLLPGRSMIGDPADTSGSGGPPLAGIIAAASDNALGIAGIAPRARLLPIRVGVSTTSEALTASGIVWAVDHGAGVILVPLTLGTGSEVLADAVDYAEQHDVLVIAPIGNGGNNEILFPAAFPSCLAVSATNNQDQLSSSSNYGPGVDLSAPGENIWTTLSGNAFGFRSSTAMAAAHVAGVAALIRSLAPQLSAEQVREVLLQSADDLGDPGPDDHFGAGRLNAGRALQTTPLPPLHFEVLDSLRSEHSIGSSITVRIADAAAHLQPGSPRARFRTWPSEPFDTTALQQVSSDEFLFEIPDHTCRRELEFYFHAVGGSTDSVTTPWNAPARTYRTYVLSAEDIFFDDFETDRGWTTEIVPDFPFTPIAGGWARGIPEPSTGSPRFDHTPDPGQRCFVTGLTAGVDLDYGSVWLRSPPIAVPPGEIEIDFAAWNYSSAGFADDLVVLVELDHPFNLATTTHIPADPPATFQWRDQRVRFRQPYPGGATLRIQFAIRDSANDSVAEAAIDDVRVRRILCPPVAGDVDVDGDVTLSDYRRMYTCLSGPEPAPPETSLYCDSSDLDQSATIDLRDVAQVQNLLRIR